MEVWFDGSEDLPPNTIVGISLNNVIHKRAVHTTEPASGCLGEGA
jgi:hypothetical protein